jgi:hypothetical protein
VGTNILEEPAASIFKVEEKIEHEKIGACVKRQTAEQGRGVNL